MLYVIENSKIINDETVKKFKDITVKKDNDSISFDFGNGEVIKFNKTEKELMNKLDKDSSIELSGYKIGRTNNDVFYIQGNNLVGKIKWMFVTNKIGE